MCDCASIRGATHTHTHTCVRPVCVCVCVCKEALTCRKASGAEAGSSSMWTQTDTQTHRQRDRQTDRQDREERREARAGAAHAKQKKGLSIGPAAAFLLLCVCLFPSLLSNSVPLLQHHHARSVPRKRLRSSSFAGRYHPLSLSLCDFVAVCATAVFFASSQCCRFCQLSLLLLVCFIALPPKSDF